MRHQFLSLLPDFGVKLKDQLAIRPQQPHSQINLALFHDHFQVLIFGEHDLISVTLPPRQFALDWLALLERHRFLLSGLSRSLDIQITCVACAVNYACYAKSDKSDAVKGGIPQSPHPL